MDSNYVDDLVDEDEIPELTEEDAARMVPFSALPEEEQGFLLSLRDAVIRPDVVPESVNVKLSAEVAAKFKATGAGWETRVDEALREWLETRKAS